MTENFTIEKSIYLVTQNDRLDLHNNYNFSDVAYSITERRVILTWHRKNDDWAQADPLLVQLEFHEVSRFHFMPRDPEMPFTEDDCLWNAGYWTDEEWCEGVMTTEAEPEANWLRAFAFHSGAIIAIAADTAKAIISR